MKGKKKKPLMLPFLLGDVKPEPISGLTRRAADGAWSGPSSLGHNSLPQPGARWGHSGAVLWLRDPQGHGWSSRDPSTPCKLHCRVVRHSITAQPESGTASLPSPEGLGKALGCTWHSSASDTLAGAQSVGSLLAPVVPSPFSRDVLLGQTLPVSSPQPLPKLLVFCQGWDFLECLGWSWDRAPGGALPGLRNHRIMESLVGVGKDL